MMSVRQKMNGRYFAGRGIETYLFDGEERFKKSGAGQTQEDGAEAGKNERLADFEKWLMAEGESNQYLYEVRKFLAGDRCANGLGRSRNGRYSRLLR